MAIDLKLSYSLKPDALSILAYDKTGIYHPVNNPTGYGGPNDDVGDFLSFSIVVKKPDPNTLLVSSDPQMWYTVDVYPQLPSITGEPFVIQNTNLGLTASTPIPDGEYEFMVTADDDGTILTDRVRYVFYAGVFCCKEKLKSQLDLKSAGCKPCRDKMFDVMFMELGIDGILYNNNCGDTKAAVDILKTLKSMCEKEGCSGCN